MNPDMYHHSIGVLVNHAAASVLLAVLVAIVVTTAGLAIMKER